MKMWNNKTLAAVLTLSALLFGVNSVFAHHFWVNSFESFSHKPGHTMVSLGWGHSIPIDDILDSPNGQMTVEEYSITSPTGKKLNLTIPESVRAEPTDTSRDFDVYDGNVGMHKIALKKESTPGVYLIQGVSKAKFYTKFIDQKGRERLKLKPKNEIKNIAKVLSSVQFQVFAKSYLTIGEWQTPKPIGTDLEIIPLSDLSNVKVGDLLKFEVRFHGEPLSYSAKTEATLGAFSNNFGQADHFFLSSYIIDGKAQFRVQSKGQWIVHCYHNEEVTPDAILKDLYGKTNNVIQGATLTFHVK